MIKKPRFNVTIFTDGSCMPNPGAGGWAAILKWGKHVSTISGGEKHSTNQRMELTGVIKSIEALKRPCRVTLYTDSSYVLGCLNKQWRVRANADLCSLLKKIISGHIIKPIWIKGHSNLTENEQCDSMAKKQALIMKGPK